MRRALIGVVTAAVSLVATPIAPAQAANSPTFRDCSAFAEGVDPDFVAISGVTVTPQGTLTVLPSQNFVTVEASESSDPGDSSGHVTLTVTVTSGHTAARSIAGAATGRVFLTVPLPGSGTGKTYTIGWAATFDNGVHTCPSLNTPDNTSPNPFVVEVG